MKGLAVLLSIVTAIALFVPAAALGQPTAPLVQEQEQRFQAEAPPAQAEMVFLVLEFAPGVWLPLHTHPASGYATVLDGTMTRRALGVESSVAVGDGWVDPATVPHQAGNDTIMPARIVATFVIPKGATLTTLVDPDTAPAPGATTLAEQRVDAPSLPSPLDIVHRIVEIRPGAQMPTPNPASVTVVSVLQGSGTVATRTLTPGLAWVDSAEAGLRGTLNAAAPVRLVMSQLLPRGAPHTVLSEGTSPVRIPAPIQLPSAR